MEKKYYTVQEFADLFRVNYRHILDAIAVGRIRAFKVSAGRRSPYRIPVSEVLRVEVEGMREVNPDLRDNE